jgi:hypothetical protein
MRVPTRLLHIPIFTEAIGGSVSDNIKSYDVAWLEHLVGDIHQPLHADLLNMNLK